MRSTNVIYIIVVIVGVSLLGTIFHGNSVLVVPEGSETNTLYSTRAPPVAIIENKNSGGGEDTVENTQPTVTTQHAVVSTQKTSRPHRTPTCRDNGDSRPPNHVPPLNFWKNQTDHDKFFKLSKKILALSKMKEILDACGQYHETVASQVIVNNVPSLSKTPIPLETIPKPIEWRIIDDCGEFVCSLATATQCRECLSAQVKDRKRSAARREKFDEEILSTYRKTKIFSLDRIEEASGGKSTLEVLEGRPLYFLDIGARSFDSSLKFFTEHYPHFDKFRVHAFDVLPLGNTFAEYAKQKGDQFEFHQAAVWVHSNGLRMNMNFNMPLASKTKGGFCIQSIDIAQFIKNEIPENAYLVIKIDVEGAEFELFQHIAESGVLNRISEVFFECHKNGNVIGFDIGTAAHQWFHHLAFGCGPNCVYMYHWLRQNGIIAHFWI